MGMAPPAEAAEARNGVEVGTRLGFGVPLGSSTGHLGDDFNKVFDNMVPLWFDLGYRAPNVYLGAYFTYGFGSIPSAVYNMGCQMSGVSCSLHDMRFGVNIHYHVSPLALFDPWIGGGIGYEWMDFSASNGTTSNDVGFSGWEFFNAQVGLDYRASDLFGIGPFACMTFAVFGNGSADVAGMSMSGSVADKALHEWAIFGVRAVLDYAPKRARDRNEDDNGNQDHDDTEDRDEDGNLKGRPRKDHENNQDHNARPGSWGD